MYSVAAFGLAFIVGHSKVSLAPRKWMVKKGVAGWWLVQLLECPACWGFHTGWIYWLVAKPDFAPGWFHLALFTTGSNFLLTKLSGLEGEDEDGSAT